MKPVTDESLAKPYHALTGAGPAPGAGLTEAEKEARENQRRKERVLTVLVESREEEKLNRLARALGIPTPPSTSDADVARLYEALAG